MKIRFRLTLLLCCLLAGFGGVGWLMRSAHLREARLMFTGLQQEREELLDRLLELTGQSLQNFANDYSRWDEMVAFVESADPAWAKINIEQSLPNFNALAAWVLRPDGRLVYTVSRLDHGALQTLPPSILPLLTSNLSEPSRHFFWDSPAGLLEVRIAPILPSDDFALTSPARGWWVVARLWDDAHLQRLAHPLQSKIRMDQNDQTPTAELNIHLKRNLTDRAGRTVRVLQVDYVPVALIRLLANNRTDAYLFFGFGLAVVSLTIFGVSRWVITPLGHLGTSLESGQTGPLQPLRRQRNEFGHLAELVDQSFSQRDMLRGEVAERVKAEVALRESEANLRRSTELYSRLARDLHDGVIQSIYAAGLGLEGVRAHLRTEPEVAEQRLTACLQSLNQTIHEVRSFITGLESAEHRQPPFALSLTTLVETMRALQPVPITLKIDEQITRPLNAAQEIHVLQFVRESISNALRHSTATALAIEFVSDPSGGCQLTVSDNGRGFDPQEKAGTGSGLENLAVRARELAGTLRVDSGLGKGTRLVLSFHQSATR